MLIYLNCIVDCYHIVNKMVDFVDISNYVYVGY